ncbi:cache domain-containing sensor histidine kinase [Paenibacillus spongiae]|uniref:Histidine kinase n=1 Tax=Paenibacillus spongiae TaxID=2909671 RepID=A0ABY5SBQ8_9BACL|nr:sensor histidine kinase [Paenibacillus spongiae]UVI29728.1 histidine kinase [Paenibacillus spongiae]
MRPFSIRNKIMVTVVLFFMLVSALGIYWYQMSARIIQDNTLKLSGEIIKQMSSRLDSYFSEIVDLTLPMIARPAVAQYLENSGKGPYERLLYTKQLNKMFYNVMVGRPDIYGISIVSQKKIAGSSYSNLYAEKRFQSIAGQLDHSGKFEIIGMNQYLDVKLFTMAVKFFSPGTQNWGIMIIDLRLDKVSAFSSGVMLGDTGFAWIADAQGRYLYYPDHKRWGEGIPVSHLDRMKTRSAGGNVENVDGKKMLVSYRWSDVTNLTFFSEVPLSELNRDLVKLRNVTFVIGIIALIFSLIVVISVSFSLTDSILVLQRMMKRVESGKLDARLPSAKKGEIGYLYRSFNSMVDEINNLIRTVSEFQLKEKESELRHLDSRMQALQYQINPHFLYNTLEIVNSHAIIENKPVISRIINSLARIFRYSVENHTRTVPLSMELDYMRDYLDIQMERFENLQVDIRIDDSLIGHVTAVPMTLQPLLENVFKHGYQKHKLEAVYLSVSGELAGDAFYLYIEDQGGGMDPHTMDYYNGLFHGTSERTECDCLGLLNVHDRIQLFFGERFGLAFVRSDHTGTVIRIALPFRNNSEQG